MCVFLINGMYAGEDNLMSVCKILIKMVVNPHGSIMWLWFDVVQLMSINYYSIN